MHSRDRDPNRFWVVYAPDPNVCDRIERRCERASIDVDSVTDLEGARERLDRRADVGGIVIAHSVSEDELEFVRTVRDRNPDLPIVLYPPDGDAREASDATAAGVTEYLPRTLDEDGDELVDRITAATDTYSRRSRLRRENAVFQSLMENDLVSMYSKDTEGRYRYVSSKVANSAPEDPIGKTDIELWGDNFEETAVEAYEDDMHVIETGEPIFAKEEHHVGENDDLWVRTTKIPWRNDDGQIQGLIGITQNITDLKRQEKNLQRQTKRLEQFASFTSHDLRNPVSVAMGYLEHAKETGDEDALEEVEWALERMDALIEDLLMLVRPNDKKLTLDWVDFSDVVERTWGAIDAPEATLRIDIPDGTLLRAVESQLRQFFENLLRNAVEHGGADVTIAIGLTDGGFYVEDDGPGIDVEETEDVFGYGHTSGGTGVGLTIVKEIASSIGCEISVAEGTAGGARFEFEDCVVLTPSLRNAVEGETVQIASETDVGGARPTGHAEFDDDRGVWTLRGGGTDIWSDTDEHYFTYTTLEGDVRIVGKVASIEDVHEFSKAGLMVRESAVAGTPLAYVGLTPKSGSEVICRPRPEDTIVPRHCTNYDGSERWYRIDRVGSTATMYTSTDGEEWTILGQKPASWGASMAIGLAVCSHDSNRHCTAQFEDVRIVTLEQGESSSDLPSAADPS